LDTVSEAIPDKDAIVRIVDDTVYEVVVVSGIPEEDASATVVYMAVSEGASWRTPKKDAVTRVVVYSAVYHSFIGVRCTSEVNAVTNAVVYAAVYDGAVCTTAGADAIVVYFAV
jgi:hypothetical protein